MLSSEEDEMKKFEGKFFGYDILFKGERLYAWIMIKGVIPWILRAVLKCFKFHRYEYFSILQPRPARPSRHPAPAGRSNRPIIK